MNEKSPLHYYTCMACNKNFDIGSNHTPDYCLFCGAKSPRPCSDFSNQKIGPYEIVKEIGKGGMGEVFLVNDPQCDRKIALKRIRLDLIEHPQIRHRFLKEAHLTCQLTHPAIIPIYSIQSTDTSVFYTMPYVEGETLKQLLREARLIEKQGEKIDHLSNSIYALMRIFIIICQAIAYAHSKGILHRDLKPENVIVGKYGEVIILDWGLAKWIQDADKQVHSKVKSPKFSTKIGKVVGTVAYMAPEIALGEPSTIQTEIYSLGVILYQLLALKPPFKRKSLKEFRKNINQESLTDPILASPHRDIPKSLAESALKCLAHSPSNRYQSVDELIRDIQNYMDGRSEWFHAGELKIHQKADWEFQENVLLDAHTAITRSSEEAEWVHLMISRHSFAGNTKLETEVYLEEDSQGIGFLISIPEVSERTSIDDGYCLWVGSDRNRTTKLLKAHAEVMSAPDIFITRNRWTKIRIEKVEKTIHLYINDTLQLSYLTHFPLAGTHIGLLSKDAKYQIHSIQIYLGSLNLSVNCLEIADAFLAHGDYPKALSEYRRIAYSFPDRLEGREALFRSGTTFLAQAKNSADPGLFLEQALDEFRKLDTTPSAPLGYLGRALIYEYLGDIEEEVKCYEMAYRRYKNYPALAILQEQILSRMHQVSRSHRLATYRFMLLSARNFPQKTLDTHTKRLFTSLQKHWEVLPFLEEKDIQTGYSQPSRLTIPLAFWLAKPYRLEEIIDFSIKNEETKQAELNILNALFCLIKLGKLNTIEAKITEALVYFESHHHVTERSFYVLKRLTKYRLEEIEILPDTPIISWRDMRVLLLYLDLAINQEKIDILTQTLKKLETKKYALDAELELNRRRIWGLLQEKKWEEAREVFDLYSIEIVTKDSSLLHFLYGCYLMGTEGYEMALIHFTGLLQVTFPRTWNLAGSYLIGQVDPDGKWGAQAFLWEKIELYRQLILYYQCANDRKNEMEFKHRLHSLYHAI